MKKILSIDGGGVKGTFPAAFLANLESDLEQPLCRYFDLIVGTSTGGIIAIGLAMGMRAADILELYESKGPDIFSQNDSGLRGYFRRILRKGRWIFWGPKYGSQNLRNSLEDVFGDTLLGEAQTRLMIPAWHSKTQTVYIFKTAHHSRFKIDYLEKAVDAAMATAAAPSYFSEHITDNGVGLIDGGVWANNPTGIATVEAISTLGWKPEELNILSVGCLDEIKEPPKSYSAASIALQLSGLFMAGQSHSSIGIAHILTGDPHKRRAIYRVSQPVQAGFYTLDNTSRIADLKDRAYAEARKQKPILEKVFFNKTADPFQPVYQVPNDKK